MPEVTLNILQDFANLNSEDRQIVDDLIRYNQQRPAPEPSQPGKGYITREYTVWCGRCEEWYQDTARSIKEVQPKFIQMGWSKTRKHGWLCPECSEKLPTA